MQFKTYWGPLIAKTIWPHLTPRDVENGIWAKGNVVTCDAVAFAGQVGNTANQLYTVALSYYFMKRVKDKVKPSEFTQTYELGMHLAIWCLAIIPNIVLLAREDFNPIETGDYCSMVDKPIGCSKNEEEECVRGKHANLDAILLYAPIVFCAGMLIMSNFTRLTIHVYRAEQMMRLERAQQSNANENDKDSAENYSFCKEIMAYTCGRCCRRSSNRDEEQAPRTLAFESFIQSSLWVAVFVMINIPPVSIFFFKAGGLPFDKLDFAVWGISTLTPLGGAFNIFTYTRPKVQKSRRVYPQLEDAPYWVLFLIVVFSGGETPKEIDLYSNSNREGRSPNPSNENHEEDIANRNIDAENIFTSDFWLKHFNINHSSQRDNSLERSFERRCEALREKRAKSDDDGGLSFLDVKDDDSELSFDA
ncbi:hypothetical protein CTEN210_02726 [Chaetoceros tenuissimus]|uniref:Uncharacterized protein n=1 Tax=Chaetoceros tenuissimus TaxID=426638 RepID=A0AAD3CHL6_9STRA|nr:hypothetical protein CTEN210_02726 [Chaetoceros tenuissimus]